MSNKQVLMIGVTVVLIGLAGQGASGTGKAPKGWFQSRMNKDYEVGIDKQANRDGKNCAYIKSIVPEPKEFTTLMQEIKADIYLNKRVRMSGYIKSAGVKGSAGMWMRVDGANDKVLRFDNMDSRRIKGNTEWQKCEIVLDVPENSKGIAFGVLMAGAGQVWMSDLKFEVVGKEVPETDMMKNIPVQTESIQPQNMDFAE